MRDTKSQPPAHDIRAGRARASGRATVRGCGAARFEPTGRNVGKSAEGHDLARHWAKLREFHELLTHTGAERLRSEVATAVPRAGQLIAFRGRCSSTQLTSDQMGPPPSQGNTPSGRYGGFRAPVLYLCETEEGVRREVTPSCGERLYIQRFVLPLKSVRLADLGSIGEPDFLNDLTLLDCPTAAEADGRRDRLLHSNQAYTLIAAAARCLAFR